MKTIKLTGKRANGVVVKVDADDFELLSRYNWHRGSIGKYSEGYASTTIKGKTVIMHRLIMNTPKGLHTDHINRDNFDNRKSNLRICNAITNSQNREKIGGLLYMGNKYYPRLRINYKSIYGEGSPSRKQAEANLEKLILGRIKNG